MKFKLPVMLIVILSVLTAGLLGRAATARTGGAPAVFLDGDKLVFDVNPVMENERILVPFRVIGEALGASVCWDQDTNTVFLDKNAIHVVIYIGKTTAFKNGEPVQLDVPAMIINQRAMVPLRFVAESLEVKVDWYGQYYSAVISSKTKLAVYYPKTTSTEAYLTREIHEIPYTKGVAAAALRELINGIVSTPGAARVLPPNTRILNITIHDGLAVVDFSAEVLNANAGAFLEVLGIQSIVDTLTEFPTIDKVSFTVEGKLDERAMNWWGHVGLYEQPFRRDLSMVYEPVIWVTAPVEGQIVNSPLTVGGSARVFEGAVCARVLNADGRILGARCATASEGAPGRGSFSLTLPFNRPDTNKLVLEVFWPDARDGTDRDKVNILLNTVMQ